MSLGKGQKISKANYFALISSKKKRKKNLFLILTYGRIILAKGKLAKGQLISKCLFGAIVSTKKPTKNFLRILALGVKSEKLKALYYSN